MNLNIIAHLIFMLHFGHPIIDHIIHHGVGIFTQVIIMLGIHFQFLDTEVMLIFV